MADVKHVARQWLETEEAFGVAEVPLPRPQKVAPKPVVPVAAPVRAPLPGARMQTTTPRPVVSSAVRIEPEMPRTKVIIAMPQPPAGNIADLPPLTRQQKEALLEKLRERTLAASAAYINAISTKLVFGEGDPDAAIMFVGEGPGIEEDKTGRPFVGRSGQLLDKMIVAMGFQRDPTGGGSGGIYIANVVKLRAAEPDETNGGRLKDRPPTPEEAARGLPVLHEQIEIIRPRVIVTLGAPAVKYVTGTTEGVMKIRGTWLSFRGVPVMPTYHPSFLLRAYTEENRRKVWGDLKMAVGKAKG